MSQTILNDKILTSLDKCELVGAALFQDDCNDGGGAGGLSVTAVTLDGCKTLT